MDEDRVAAAIADIVSLSVFSGLRRTPLLGGLEAFLRALLGFLNKGGFEEELAAVEAWAAFSPAFVCGGKDGLSGALAALPRRDENPWTLAAERGEEAEPFLEAAARADLDALGRVAAFDFGAVAGATGALSKRRPVTPALARVRAECGLIQGGAASGNRFFRAEALREDIRSGGAGLLYGHAFFIWDGGLRPAFNPDPVSFAALSGYERERELVACNTRRFLDGGGANNILLYGDRGTGKSATVKAVCNEYAARGLRLLEIRKEDFPAIPRITNLLGRRGLKFILFIDDLSFETQDDSFMTLKALLEGGAERKPDNIIVYATSNRRHFVKENAADRPGGPQDIRGFDTLQEQLSLSDRFGLTVVFAAPSREDYLRIAESVAAGRGFLNPQNEEERRVFRENALIWERWFNGRSPRTADQYVRWVAAGLTFPWN